VAVLATFAGTFTFVFSLLRRVDDDPVPDIGVMVAGLAVAASLGLLLFFSPVSLITCGLWRSQR
jgi:uncharacterized membrane protein